MDRPTALFKSSLRICLMIAPVLAAVMSLTSDYNHHPDEIHHFEAVQYYIHGFIPPEIGDPGVRSSYSVWGVSYLNYHWIEYFLAGKFVLVFSPISGYLLAARLFNVLLLAGLCAFFVYKSFSDQDVLLPASVLLITPQVWYVFSYVNNDAFALAVSMLLAFMVADPQGRLNRFLVDRGWSNGAFGFAILLGLLLISKTNYYVFIAFLAVWLLYKWPVVEMAEGRAVVNFDRVRKYTTLVVIGLSIFAFRIALDLYVNGETNFVGLSYGNYIAGNFEKKPSRLLAYQEEIADPLLKPSAIEHDIANTHPSLRLRDKGAPFSSVFTEWRWHEMSFRSFVGLYGYMNIHGPGAYYLVMGILFAAFGVYAVVAIIRRRRRDEMVAFGLLLFGILITAFMSSYLSWTYAVQAQGRYLFPALPMAALFVYVCREALNRKVVTVFVLICFLLSVYSFLVVGVGRINSVPPPGTTIETTQAATGAVIRREQG
ncbi:MAG TPA: hypothetical protein VNA22_00500 [Pyrinomonadaceae bacterium]|nr:hypothetical protein [Pyrinomonadaceae bacterium]